MAEKIYDYSNKKSYDGVAPKENEALVPFLAHEVLKNYHQDVRDGFRKRMTESSRTTSKLGTSVVERF